MQSGAVHPQRAHDRRRPGDPAADSRRGRRRGDAQWVPDGHLLRLRGPGALRPGARSADQPGAWGSRRADPDLHLHRRDRRGTGTVTEQGTVLMTYATARLSDADIEALGSELDRIRADVVASRGERDASYIHTVIKVQRGLEVGGRTLLLGSLLPPLWLAGTAMLSAAKILEKMDIGYTIIRMSEDQAWRPWHLAQPAYNLLLAAVFEWGIALFDLELDDVVHGRKSKRELFDQVRAVLGKAIRQAAKDYVLFPLLSGPSAVPTLVANLTANVVRNVWAHTTIFCGHFPDGVEQFTVAEVDGELLDAVREVPA